MSTSKSYDSDVVRNTVHCLERCNEEESFDDDLMNDCTLNGVDQQFDGKPSSFMSFGSRSKDDKHTKTPSSHNTRSTLSHSKSFNNLHGKDGHRKNDSYSIGLGIDSGNTSTLKLKSSGKLHRDFTVPRLHTNKKPETFQNIRYNENEVTQMLNDENCNINKVVIPINIDIEQVYNKEYDNNYNRKVLGPLKPVCFPIIIECHPDEDILLPEEHQCADIEFIDGLDSDYLFSSDDNLVDLTMDLTMDLSTAKPLYAKNIHKTHKKASMVIENGGKQTSKPHNIRVTESNIEAHVKKKEMIRNSQRDLEYTQIVWRYPNESIDEARRICSDLLPRESESFLRIKSVELQNHNYPLLMNYIDAYSRYRVNHPAESVTISEFLYRERHRLKIPFLGNIGSQTMDWFKAGMDTVSRYLFPNINYNPQWSICDNYDIFARYVIAMNNVIYKGNMLCDSGGNTNFQESEHMPAQIDLWIIPRVVKKQKAFHSLNDNEWNDDDSSDDERNDDERKDDILELADRDGDKIWNIEHNLINNGYVKDLNYFVCDQKRGNIYFEQHEFYELEKKLTALLRAIGWRNKRYRRYIIIVDRRNPEHIKNREMIDDTHKVQTWNDKIYLICPKICGMISKNYTRSNECFAVNTTRYLLPLQRKPMSFRYINDYIKGFGGLDPGNGYKFVLSYHIYSAQRVKTYWYLNNGVQRFEPDDIERIWSLYFKKQIILSDECKIALMRTYSEYMLKDSEFAKFINGTEAKRLLTSNFSYIHRKKAKKMNTKINETEDLENDEEKQETIIIEKVTPIHFEADDAKEFNFDNENDEKPDRFRQRQRRRRNHAVRRRSKYQQSDPHIIDHDGNDDKHSLYQSLYKKDNIHIINNLLSKYYELVGHELGDKFINFMKHSEDDDAKEFHFEADDDLLLRSMAEFDEDFPVLDSRFVIADKADRRRFIFYFMQYCYINKSIPPPSYMLRKYKNNKMNPIDDKAGEKMLEDYNYNYNDVYRVSNFIQRWNDRSDKTKINLQDIVNCLMENRIHENWFENHTKREFILILKEKCKIKACPANALWNHLFIWNGPAAIHANVRNEEIQENDEEKQHVVTEEMTTNGLMDSISDEEIDGNTTNKEHDADDSVAGNTVSSEDIDADNFETAENEHLKLDQHTNVTDEEKQHVVADELTPIDLMNIISDERSDANTSNKEHDADNSVARDIERVDQETVSSEDIASTLDSSTSDMYYKPLQRDSSSDDMVHADSSMSASDLSTDNNMSDRMDNANIDIIQNALSSVGKLLNIIHEWEISVKGSYLNNIIRLSHSNKNGKSLRKLGTGNQNNQADSDETQHGENNNSKRNGNNDHDDHKDGDDGGYGDDGGHGDDGDDDAENNDNNDENYFCNVPWHEEQIIYVQCEEIRELKIKLQIEKELNSLMRIDRAIGDYYRTMEVLDYYDVEGNGRFLQYVTKQNLNNGKFILSEQLADNANPQNCIYTQFDSEFPFPNFIDVDMMNDPEKQNIIFGIIQYCYQNNIAPSQQYIRQNLYHAPQQQSQLTVIDGLYQWIKHSDKEYRSLILSLQQLLAAEEYDSEALSMDIVTDDNNNSNIIQLTQNKNECDVIQQYMCQHASEYVLYPDLVINPSKKLTMTTIGKKVAEKFRDEWCYMKNYVLIHGHHAMIKCNDDKNLVIDYNFHCKKQCEEKENNSLYVVCDWKKKKNKNDFEWKMRDRLFKWDKIQKMFKISKIAKPKPMKMESMLMYAFEKQRQQILCLLQNEKEISKLIKHKSTPWTDRDKIKIVGKRSKSLSLYLSKTEWVERLSKFANNNADNITLLPIITVNGNKYCVETVWIVQIGININIGISLKIHRNYSKCESLMALAIYLDINDNHKLIPYQHDCQCLNDFVCNIDDLRIGDSKQKELQKTLNKANQRIKTLENQLNKNESNIERIDIPSDDMVILENEEEKKEVISKEELTPNHLINNYEQKRSMENHQEPQNIDSNISTTTSIINASINNDNKNNEYSLNVNDERNCQCLAVQKNIALQASLNEAKKQIKSLENLREMDINTIVKIKSGSIMLENNLKKTQQFVQTLLRKQTEFEQEQNRQQQIITSLEVEYAYITKLKDINNFYFQQTRNPQLSIIIPHQQHLIDRNRILV